MIASLHEIRICFDRLLPDTQSVGAGAQRMSLLKAKKWAPGTTLRIGFAGGTAEQKRNAQVAAEAIMQYANIDFRFNNPPTAIKDIRCTFDPRDGAWSYLGTDITNIPKNQATMNLGFENDPRTAQTAKHEFCHCLVGETLIDCPRDLSKYPRGIPIKDLVGQTPWVYAWKDGQIVVRKAAHVWLSKRNVPTVRVQLTPGRGHRPGAVFTPPLELIGTANHPVLLVDGKTWKNLGDLTPGDRLCSLYRRGQYGGSRSSIYWTRSQDAVMEHVFVCEQVNGERPEYHDCHHKNECKLDQRVDNLEWKNKTKHCSDHHRGRKRPKESVARGVALRKARYQGISEETRLRMSLAQQGKKATAETRAKLSAARKGKPQSVELAAKRAEGMRRFYANGGRSGMYGKKASAETRAKQSASRLRFEERKRQEQEAAVVNHVVISVEEAGRADVYDMMVPDAESFVANGVVVHNSLAAVHEHSVEGGIKWNKEAVYREYSGPPNNWTRDQIDSNVLETYSRKILNGTEFDPLSIMAYPVDPALTLDGRGIGFNADFSELDKRWLRDQYPGRGPGPGPITPVFDYNLDVVDLSPNKQSISKPGERDLARLTIKQSGRYVIEAQSRGDRKVAVVLTLFGPNNTSTMVAQTNNAQTQFDARLDLMLMPGEYAVQVSNADLQGIGDYGLVCLYVPQDSGLLDLPKGEITIGYQGVLLPGRYSFVRQG